MTFAPDPARSRHSLATRLLHGALALSVGAQLLTGLVAQPPTHHHPANTFFFANQLGGALTALLSLWFWAIIATRQTGTPATLLLPWFSASARSAFLNDAARHLVALRAGRLPPAYGPSPATCAAQGIGLALVTAMGATGLIGWAGQTVSAGEAAMVAHHLIVPLVWAYILGHGVTAVLNHYALEVPLGTMWSAHTPDDRPSHDRDPQVQPARAAR